MFDHLLIWDWPCMAACSVFISW